MRSQGVGELFDAVEIVSDKDVATYARIFSRYGDGPEQQHDGRQFAEVGRRPGDRGGKLGRLRSRTSLPGWSSMSMRRSIIRASGRIAHLGQLAATIAEIEGR